MRNSKSRSDLTPGGWMSEPQVRPEPTLSGKRRVLLWIELVVAGLLTLFFGLAGIGVLSTLGQKGSTVVGGIVCVIIMLLAGWWLARVIFRLHHPHVGARTMAAPGSLRMPLDGSGRRRTRHSKHSARNTAVIFTVFGLISLGLLPVGLHDAHRSAYTQAHGVPSIGRVISVDNTQSCSKGSCWWTSADLIDLTTPRVNGATTTTLHTPFATSLTAGDMVSLLVDPQEPSWSEIPGHPLDHASAWYAFVIIGGLYWLIAGLGWYALWRRARRPHPDGAIAKV
jgi:hypothetical protein